MPIRAFKDGNIVSKGAQKEPELIFKSSGTSGMNRSTHNVQFEALYKKSIIEGFTEHFPLQEYSVYCYLPEYKNNPHSSLIWMAKHLIENDPSGQSEFISDQDLFDEKWIAKINRNGRKPLLFGAAFGLVDLLKSGKPRKINGLEILETGGMKTHRREISKSELRTMLSEGFQTEPDKIHSEYGMCELLSQMYAIGSEWFDPPHWVQVTIRDPENPMRICERGEEGKIGIIDLANIYSCPFLLTGDKGVMNESGTFRVLGRWDPKDLRGCNFLIDHE